MATPFSSLLDKLAGASASFKNLEFDRFSDMELEEMRELRDRWYTFPPSNRLNLLTGLEEYADNETRVNFDPVALLALEDEEGSVRAQAISMLWEYVEPEFAQRLMQIYRDDPDEDVKAMAAGGLGRFIYEGEINKIPVELESQIEDLLLEAARIAPAEKVRMKALEALGFSRREQVPDLIREALIKTSRPWLVSALTAIARSYDEQWERVVLSLMESSWGDVQLKAVEAAGELTLSNAKPMLLDMIRSRSTDSEVRQGACWALSQIGGEGVRDALQRAQKRTRDADEYDYIEDALANLDLTDMSADLSYLEINQDALGTTQHVVDLETGWEELDDELEDEYDDELDEDEYDDDEDDYDDENDLRDIDDA